MIPVRKDLLGGLVNSVHLMDTLTKKFNAIDAKEVVEKHPEAAMLAAVLVQSQIELVTMLVKSLTDEQREDAKKAFIAQGKQKGPK